MPLTKLNTLCLAMLPLTTLFGIFLANLFLSPEVSHPPRLPKGQLFITIPKTIIKFNDKDLPRSTLFLAARRPGHDKICLLNHKPLRVTRYLDQFVLAISPIDASLKDRLHQNYLQEELNFIAKKRARFFKKCRQPPKVIYNVF